LPAPSSGITGWRRTRPRRSSTGRSSRDGAQKAKVIEDALLVRFPGLKGKLIVG
jgi:hypothetical protein